MSFYTDPHFLAGDTNRDKRLPDPPSDVVSHADHVAECGGSGFCSATSSPSKSGPGVGENSLCRYSGAPLCRRSLLGVPVRPGVSLRKLGAHLEPPRASRGSFYASDPSPTPHKKSLACCLFLIRLSSLERNRVLRLSTGITTCYLPVATCNNLLPYKERTRSNEETYSEQRIVIPGATKSVPGATIRLQDFVHS